mmetsp:Transcript_13410/g.28442  ORF Transcript_13410/g.28442 Transcript_13410/m.28442 type:complete len:149 (+) Transcript_13410:1116-1562(+)
MALPKPPEVLPLGTTSELGENVSVVNKEKREQLKNEAIAEMERREARGEGDMWLEMQKITPQILNKKFHGFRVEMLFSSYEEDGATCLNWYHGIVKRVVNAEKEQVRIEWDESCLGEGDEKITIQQLKANKWNPKKPREGAWRQYLTN